MTNVFGLPLPTKGGDRDTWSDKIDAILVQADADVTAVESSVSSLTAAQAYVLISTQTASASSSISFTSLSSTYAAYVVEFYGVYMSASGSGLGLTTSTNNGSSYGSSYSNLNNAIDAGGTPSDSGSSSTSYIFVFGNDSVTDTAAESASGKFTIRNHASGTAKTHVLGETLYTNSSGLAMLHVGGQSNTAQDTDAIKLQPTNGGTITAGTFKLYGVKA